MKKFTFISLIFFSLAFNLNVFAQSPTHTVLSGQTIYSIAKQYNISQEELIRFNPSLENGLKAGTVLKLPASASTPQATAAPAPTTNSTSASYAGLHIVEEGETLYGVARLYQVSVQKLLELNPDAKDGIRTGQTLKVPTLPASTGKTHTVQASETFSSISRLYQVDMKVLMEANVEAAARGLRIGDVLQIPAKQTSNTQTAASTPATTTTAPPSPTPSATASKTTPITTKRVKIALLLPFMLNDTQKQDATIDKFLEFYEGALLGISQMKDEGISVELSTFDIEKTEEKVREVLLQNASLKTVDLIIGPAYSNQVNAVAEFAQANKVPVLVPFTSNVAGLAKNPYILQNNSSMNSKNIVAANLFINKLADKNLIIMRFNSDPDDEGSEFARTLKNQLTKQEIAFEDVMFTQENFVSISKYFVSGKENVLVLATEKELLVRDLLPKIRQYNSKETPISVFGFDDWGKTLKAYPSVYYYTPFYVNPKRKENAVYRAKFRQEFGYPTYSVPRFDLMGYDLTTYFVKAINAGGKNFTDTLDTFEQKQVLQSRLKFRRLNDKGGFVNEGMYIVFTNEAGTYVLE